MQDRIDYKKIDFNSAREILGGKNVVFTGRGFLVRGELMRLARQAGANVDTVVTKKCDLLIVGEKPGSKLRKAKVLGCEIITTNDFKDILEGKISNVENDIDEDILNINTNENINEVIYILRKNILLLINNEAIKMKTIRNIKLNGGNIIENFEEEKVDLIVYQPSSKITNILDKAKKDNINTISLGVFNKMLMK
ncbi:MAG: BRCT domain-containing protein [Clostridium saudiense]|uniref:BRCT domain-containing protein n=1 Tax=Clostridium saudiense TaxID=1414720 RepID=UPI00290C07C8|nr:BRCT domain-containing protein [Clostridium saudiense]MDU3522829.1 BRCT domain-containing protein [Clostridium saudiense]